jgi:two-component system chemotaxis sensor kinase CheA
MPDPFVNDFIDDYYAECDEHLTTIRRVLIELDEYPHRAPYPDQMAELSRALHTIKGLSGMVGFADAEAIAHLLEDWLSRNTEPGRPFAPSALEGLFDGARLLEASIAAHRADTAGPDFSAFRRRVMQAGDRSRNVPKAEGARPKSPSDTVAADSVAARVFEFVFTPSRELAAEGVTVETVRAELSEIGTIVHAAPRMREEGGVSFLFTVALHADTQTPAQDYGRGVTCSEKEAAAAPTAGETEGDRAALLRTASAVRVELPKLDELMRLVGDLVVTRGRIDDALAHLDLRRSDIAALSDASARMERQLRSLHEAVLHVRMVPMSEVFDRMRYAVREVARDTGKQISVEIEGQETEIDKLVVEQMLEPLLHLVRNAASHGIEVPQIRTGSNKAPVGTISLRARTAGERIVIEIEDNGAGIDFGDVERRARQMHVIGEGESITASNILQVLSAPGFSTREAADMSSGRGVGMAVVQQRVTELGGTIALDTAAGRGSLFTIRLPLTLMIVNAIMFRIEGNLMAVPQPGVREVLQVGREEITPFENNEVIPYRESVLPIFRLRKFFGLPNDVAARALEHVLVIGSESSPIGIIVDRIVGQREIVVRSITDPLVTVPAISGATELSDGSVALIIDTTRLMEHARDGTLSAPMLVQRG